MSRPRYSIVIPVYNRPEEVAELLTSLSQQSFTSFEVIIVEDGSEIRCDNVVDRFRDKLHIQYFFKQNSGPGPSRNFGFSQARGDYFVVFDSDCIVPPEYFKVVDDAITKYGWEAWGGPDRAHESFTPMQRAMGYTMSSVLTTGGIRGSVKHIGDFQPRSFNMGLSRKVFEVTGGFKFTHFAEDIDLSIRMKQTGFKVGLIPDAYVYHKRRTDFGQFFRQVKNFGLGRAIVGKIHPKEVKLTHWVPSIFLMGMVALIIMPMISWPLFLLGISFFFLYLLAIFLHCWSQSGDVLVAVLSVPSTLIQFSGYGIGFLLGKFFK